MQCSPNTNLTGHRPQGNLNVNVSTFRLILITILIGICEIGNFIRYSLSHARAHNPNTEKSVKLLQVGEAKFNFKLKLVYSLSVFTLVFDLRSTIRCAHRDVASYLIHDATQLDHGIDQIRRARWIISAPGLIHDALTMQHRARTARSLAGEAFALCVISGSASLRRPRSNMHSAICC